MFWSFAVLAAIAISLWLLNATSLPLELARRVVGSMSEQTGWSVDLGSARFVGPTRLVIEDVEISGPHGVRADVPRAYVSFDPVSLLSTGRREFRWGKVDLVGAHFVAPSEALWLWSAPSASSPGADATRSGPTSSGSSRPGRSIAINIVRGALEEQHESGPSSLWRAEGELVAAISRNPGIRIRNLRLEQRAENVALSVRAAGDDLDAVRWEAEGPADLLLAKVGSLPLTGTGSMRAEGDFDLRSRSGDMSIEVENGDVAWSGERVPFDRMIVDLDHTPEAFVVRSMTIHRAGASLVGDGSVTPVDGDLHMELRVFARGLSLPRDIPHVERYGLSGSAEFSGVIAGTFADPEVSGRLKVSEGTVWQRPVDHGEGIILLRRGLFRFGKTELVRGDARYELHGEASPSQTTIELAAVNGDLQEMLFAAGVEQEASGSVDGSFSIRNDGEGLSLRGTVEARAVEVSGQAFDFVSGQFDWSGSKTALQGVRFASGDGIGSAAGTIERGAIDVALSLDRWPIPKIFGLEDRLQGWVSFSGKVNGSVVDPMVQGRLQNGRLDVGGWRIESPRGDIVVTKDLVHLTRLSARSAGDGQYEVTGDITGWNGEDTALDLDVIVENASLSGILSQGGWTLPALLFDGMVSGNITVDGPAASPTATFDLSLRDEFGFGEPVNIRFQVDEGRLKLGRTGRLFGLGA